MMSMPAIIDLSKKNIIMEQTNVFTNPLNLALLAILGYIAYQQFFSPKPAPPPPPKHKKVIEIKDYTPKELAKFNGENGAPIYLAISGKVYDVSSKPDFYGPGGDNDLIL
jgi:membrane-associated progesterone receptor component